MFIAIIAGILTGYLLTRLLPIIGVAAEVSAAVALVMLVLWVIVDNEIAHALLIGVVIAIVIALLMFAVDRLVKEIRPIWVPYLRRFECRVGMRASRIVAILLLGGIALITTAWSAIKLMEIATGAPEVRNHDFFMTLAVVCPAVLIALYWTWRTYRVARREFEASAKGKESSQ